MEAEVAAEIAPVDMMVEVVALLVVGLFVVVVFKVVVDFLVILIGNCCLDFGVTGARL